MGLRLYTVLVSVPLLVGAATAAPAPPPRVPALTWVFDIHQDEQLIPHGKVHLRVGTKRVLIEPKAGFLFQPVTRPDYKYHQVPASALTACTGWFAGGGEDIYVIQRRNTLRVYRRYLDEESGIFPYKLIRTIPLAGR